MSLCQLVQPTETLQINKMASFPSKYTTRRCYDIPGNWGGGGGGSPRSDKPGWSPLIRLCSSQAQNVNKSGESASGIPVYYLNPFNPGAALDGSFVPNGWPALSFLSCLH